MRRCFGNLFKLFVMTFRAGVFHRANGSMRCGCNHLARVPLVVFKKMQSASAHFYMLCFGILCPLCGIFVVRCCRNYFKLFFAANFTGIFFFALFRVCCGGDNLAIVPFMLFELGFAAQGANVFVMRIVIHFRARKIVGTNYAHVAMTRIVLCKGLGIYRAKYLCFRCGFLCLQRKRKYFLIDRCCIIECNNRFRRSTVRQSAAYQKAAHLVYGCIGIIGLHAHENEFKYFRIKGGC